MFSNDQASQQARFSHPKVTKFKMDNPHQSRSTRLPFMAIFAGHCFHRLQKGWYNKSLIRILQKEYLFHVRKD